MYPFFPSPPNSSKLLSNRIIKKKQTKWQLGRLDHTTTSNIGQVSKDRNVILDTCLIYLDNPTETEKTHSFQAHIGH